ncbi:MAG: DUF5680 domain-containing protein [Candidatus Marsarchaeota archaeon]|nr:DUF5680 domain-containing protein [Candidatus Marsarchaeota archaeon]MCL5111530.1 DUF5680 domain-containing protein [Candidatus Marsarchaeota archaeon]
MPKKSKPTELDMKSEVRKFLIVANLRGYAADNTKAWIKEKDGSTTIVYEREDWKYHDNFFGGEPYGGREVVFYKGEPVWMMVYYGAIVETESDVKGLYQFLQRALRADPESNPYRGPKSFKEGELEYRNSWTGEVESFSGEEGIYRAGKRIYWAKYLGGFVDQRAE